ncbi:Hypothetical predicted protein, partial [Olea europaea subsp. europaea]
MVATRDMAEETVVGDVASALLATLHRRGIKAAHLTISRRQPSPTDVLLSFPHRCLPPH